MTKQLATKWTSHLKDKEKDNFAEYVRSASAIFERLDQILKEKEPVSDEADYDKASWPYYRADQDGYSRALKDIRKLFPIDLTE